MTLETIIRIDGISVPLSVNTVNRDRYFAATANPFAITAYGKTEVEAETRAVETAEALLNDRFEKLNDLEPYLVRLGVQYTHVK